MVLTYRFLFRALVLASFAVPGIFSPDAVRASSPADSATSIAEALVSSSKPAPADNASTAPLVLMHFWFKDSVRGTALRPEAVLLDGHMIFQQADEAGKLDITARAGDHQVTIKLSGYKDMVARETALLSDAPMNIILLDPVHNPPEIEPDSLARAMPADGTLLIGYVTDDQLARPIPGATVTLLPKGSSVQSDKNGFFQLPVSMKDSRPFPDDPNGNRYGTVDFKVSKPGFGDDEHRKVLVETGEPKQFEIVMVRGGGGDIHDEEVNRNNLQSGLFGKYNVEPEHIGGATSPTVKAQP